MQRLGINIDHIATIRNARGEGHPNILKAARDVMKMGADSITIHLREDRRHIQDRDIFRLNEEIGTYLNLELAATEEMKQIALQLIPSTVCVVPERREEVTTEGGLDISRNFHYLTEFCSELAAKGIVEDVRSVVPGI